MREVVFGAEARRDVVNLWEHIAADNLSAADQMRDRMYEALELLAEFPGIGHQRVDVSNDAYRFWVVRPYVIAYRYDARRLTVVRIVHGARDFRRIFR